MKKERNKKNKKEILAAIICLIIVLASVACVFCFVGNKDNGGEYEAFKKTTNTTSKIGISYSIVGSANRQTPEIDDEGLSRYPVYGQTLTKAEGETDDDLTSLKQAILNENSYLNSDPSASLLGTCSNYNSIDEDGYLFLNGNPVLDGDGSHRKLYKHTASNNMYFGNVSSDEKAVVKQIKIQPRQMGNYITGLYAPAGEVMKLTISKDDLSAIGGFNIYVGATLANGQANNIWLARDFNRMPVIANKIPVSEDVCSFDEASQTYTCFFGSYLGGPIYIGSPNSKVEFKVEISGAVEYPHFIYGLTTEEEYNRLLKSSAPYFDFEIFDNAVRFSGPRTYSDNYSYSELCKAAELWDKIATVSKQVPSGSNSSYGIDFLFDPFVASGAAVAFVGRNTVNCPVNWIDGCLNAENFITNGGWGNIHEFNHHFQNFGLPNGGEVTNNAISLVEYSLFTKISSQRSLNDNSLRDWNVYTDASRALRILLENSAKGNAVESLDAYATVLHSFGQSVFLQATKNGKGIDNWFKNLCNLTHYNFSYYFTEILHETVSSSVLEEINQKNYPMYVPVACIYQTGTKFNFGGETKQIKTVQPFEFIGESYDFNIKSLLQLPSGFKVGNITVGNSQYGKIVKLGDDQYRFIPSSERVSGDIDVRISITKEDGAFEVEDVVLVFGFKQQQKRIAERTTYYFDENLLDVFESVDDAVSKNYVGSSSSSKFDSRFNGNECAAVWWNSEGVKLNSISEYNSKIYISSNNTYRFSIRGKYANLYISLDGENFELVAKAGSTYNNNFSVCVQNGEYKDFELKKGQVVFIKAVVMHVDVTSCAFVVGMGAFSNGNVNLDDVTKSTTAYNINFEKEEFKTEYFVEREYQISSFEIETNNTSSVVSTNFSPWDSTTELNNLFDGNSSTFMHNKQGEYVSLSSPFEIVVDLGKTIKTNKIVMYGRATSTQTPTSFKLFGGLEKDCMSLLCEYENEPLKNGCNQVGNFDLTEIRYYKLVVTKTNANYICLSKIEFNITFENGKLLSPDSENINYFGQWSLNYDLSTFGHSYVSKSGYAEINFSGSQIAILSRKGIASKFTISIDDAKEILIEFDGSSELMFLSDVLENKAHKVVIKPVGEIDIVSFATR